MLSVSNLQVWMASHTVDMYKVLFIMRSETLKLTKKIVICRYRYCKAVRFRGDWIHGWTFCPHQSHKTQF